MAATTTRIRSTSKYKALIAAGVNDDAAVNLCKSGVPKVAVVKADPIAELVNAGFSRQEAKDILSQHATTAPDADAEPEFDSEEFVTEAGYKFAKGRVYVNTDIIEGAVRVMKNGAPTIVKTSGAGRTKAVLIMRQDSGDVSIQNLA